MLDKLERLPTIKMLQAIMDILDCDRSSKTGGEGGANAEAGGRERRCAAGGAKREQNPPLAAAAAAAALLRLERAESSGCRGETPRTPPAAGEAGPGCSLGARSG
jgi:hypothetical protein